MPICELSEIIGGFEMALVRLETGLAICFAEDAGRECCRRETFHCEGCREFREMVDEGRVKILSISVQKDEIPTREVSL